MTTAYITAGLVIIFGCLGYLTWCLNYLAKATKEALNELEVKNLRIASLQRTTADWLAATSPRHKTSLRQEVIVKIHNLSKA